MKGQLKKFVSARVDLAKLSARRALMGVATWALIVLLASGLCLTAVVFLFYGAAEGLGLWLQKPWLGYLLTGGSLLLLLAAVLLMIALARRSESKRLHKEAKEATRDFNEHLKETVRTLAPLEWTREHPWTSTGAAAAAGFVVAGAVTSSPAAPPRTDHSPSNEAAAPNEPSLILSALVSTAMSILKGALTPIVMDFVKELNLSELFGVNVSNRTPDAPPAEPDTPPVPSSEEA